MQGILVQSIAVRSAAGVNRRDRQSREWAYWPDTMEKAMTLKWNGKALLKDVLRAAVPATWTAPLARLPRKAASTVRKDSGDLAKSLTSVAAEIQGDEVVGGVAAGEHYAIIEEVRKPYLRPALDAEGPQLWKRIRENLK